MYMPFEKGVSLLIFLLLCRKFLTIYSFRVMKGERNRYICIVETCR